MTKSDKIMLGICLGAISIALIQHALVKAREAEELAAAGAITTAEGGSGGQDGSVEGGWHGGSMAPYVTMRHEVKKPRPYKEIAEEKRQSISNRLHRTGPVRLELPPEFDQDAYRSMLEARLQEIKGTNAAAIARRKQLEEIIKSGKIML